MGLTDPTLNWVLIINPLKHKKMKVLLNIHCECFIQGDEQHCNTPEGFMAIQEMHPEDHFVVENEESQKALDLYKFFDEICIAL